MDTAIGVFVRVATAFTLLLSAALIANYIKRKMPEGRIKRILFKRLSP